MDRLSTQVALAANREYQVLPSYVDDELSSNLFNVQLIQNEEIVDLIQRSCNELNPDLIALSPAQIISGNICIAKYGAEPSYYRGVIDSVNMDEKKATIIFYDYGNTEIVSFEDLAQMPSMACSFVPQAYLCEWENATKKGLGRLYNRQIEEGEIAIKVLDSRVDNKNKLNSTIYIVSIPELEQAAQVIEVPKINNEVTTDGYGYEELGQGTDVADGGVSIPVQVPASRPAEALKKEVLNQIDLANGNTQPLEEAHSTPSSAVTSSVPVVNGDVTTTTPARQPPASNGALDILVSRPSQETVGTNTSLTTTQPPMSDFGTMTMAVAAQQEMLACPSTPGIYLSNDQFMRKYEECLNRLKTDADFVDRMCTKYALDAMQ